MATSYNAGKIVTDGLVLYLDAANPKSYPGTGNTWFDLSGNRNNGTLTNGPTYDSANKGSIVFDGNDDYINCGSSYSNLFSAGLTFSAWIKIPNYTKTQRILTINNAANSAFDLFFQIQITSGVIGSGTALSAQYRLGTTAIPLNSWSFVTSTCEYTSNGFSVYYNGSLNNGTKQGTTPAYTANKGNLELGRLILPPVAYGTLSIANCSVYNRALSASEIQQNFNALRGRYGI